MHFAFACVCERMKTGGSIVPVRSTHSAYLNIAKHASIPTRKSINLFLIRSMRVCKVNLCDSAVVSARA